jgi:deoxyribose-phosphate aldolase
MDKRIKMKATRSQIAKLIDHAVLHPTVTDKDVSINCELVKKYNVASLCVKPYHVKQAYKELKNSTVLVCAVIGFPHGNNSIKIKKAETKEVIKNGAQEVDMVVNIGKVIQHDWKYVKKEIETIYKVCTHKKVPLKVIFETDFVTEDEDKIKLCQICSNIGVAFVKTSTGFGYVKLPDGHYDYKGATDHDITLMKNNTHKMGIKASGGIKSLEDILRLTSLGATRIGTSSTAAILDSIN